MNKVYLLMILVLLSACKTKENSTTENIPVTGPIQLHPENPHYFLYKGKPMALVSSAEHYGSVLNLNFDYQKYLRTLTSDGMNYTRIFTGTYFEIAGRSFSIQNNTLAPEIDKVITPWTTVGPDISGRLRYDLSRWNIAYFERLQNFIRTAADNDIIVEVTLFSSIYNDNHWDINPQNPANNINIDQDISRQDAQTLNNGPLLEHQLNFVRKMVDELNDFDNFFFEIQNEPWSDHPVPVYNIVNKEDLNPGDWTYKADLASEESMKWQAKVASVINEEEDKLGKKHLIAQNCTNFRASIPFVGSNISIINFHYAWPEAVEWNYHFNKIIGFDESGFAGSGDQVYRRQAWQFIMSGGGLFNNLDYSFFTGHEDGLGVNKAPGGGSESLRRQLKVLSDFINSPDLVKLHPDYSSVTASPGLIPYVLSDRNNSYLAFVRATGTNRTTLEIKAEGAEYRVQILNTFTGVYFDPVFIKSRKGILTIDIDIPDGELALKITKNK